MKSIVECAHAFLAPVLHPAARCIDATLGRGKDTRFFLDHAIAHVYAFEVQPALCQAARAAMPDSRLQIFNTGHEHMEKTLDLDAGSVDAIVFNFGWDPQLPGSLCTHADTSLAAIEQACHLLRPKGRMALVLYPHAEGVQEEQAILEYFCRQPAFEIMEVSMPFKKSPKVLLVEKKNRKGTKRHESK